MRTDFDYAPFYRATVGFDRLFDFLESASRAEQDNYPPFDIEKLADDTVRHETGARSGACGEHEQRRRRRQIRETSHRSALIASTRRTRGRPMRSATRSAAPSATRATRSPRPPTGPTR